MRDGDIKYMLILTIIRELSFRHLIKNTTMSIKTII